MTDEPIDGLVAGATAFDDATVVALDLRGAEQELLEEIMSTPLNEQPTPAEAPAPAAPAEDRRPQRAAVPDALLGRRERSTHRRLVSVLAALAVAAVLAGVMVLPSLVSSDDPTGPNAGPDRTAAGPFSAAARRVADANPRILVDAPGWEVTHVEGFEPTDGELELGNGGRELQLNWRPAGQHREYLDDRRDASRPQAVQVLGGTAQLYTYGPGDFTVITPVRGRVFLELRGGAGDRAAFLSLLDRLEVVDVDTWLAAMPASVVKPDEEAEVAEQMLADVPVPDGFDTSRLPTGGTNDYYQYGARVTGEVTCAWIEDWRQARSNGDQAEVRRAATALSSSHGWQVLRRMDAAGDFPEVVWEIADQVAAGKLPAEYQQGLGCD